jgi:hypothetical protein
MRRTTIRGLGRLAAADTIDSVLRCLDDPDELVRAEAVAALGHFKDRRVVIPILRAARMTSYAISTAASRALRSLGDLAHEDLIAALAQPDLADTAATMLAEIGPPAVPAVVAAMRKGGDLEEQGLAILARTDLNGVQLDADLWRKIDFRRMLNGVADGNGALCHISKDHTTAYVLDSQPRKTLEREISGLTAFVEREALQLSTPELQRVLDLGETHVRVQATCGSSDYLHQAVDSSRLRQLARQELIRRGVPA